MCETDPAVQKKIFEGDNKSSIKIWDAKTGKLVTTLQGHTHWVMCLAWTQDGERLISGSLDHSIRI
jgi:WD40 repeat protein